MNQSAKHSENHPAKNPVNKPAKQPGKQPSCVVLARLYPAARDVEAALQTYHEFCKAITKDYPNVQFELICAVDGQMAWIETWKSRADLTAHYDNSVGLTDFPARFMQLSKKPPERLHLQPAGMVIK